MRCTVKCLMGTTLSLLLFACSRECHVFEDIPDLTAQEAASQGEYQASNYSVQDLQQGTGAFAQSGRRMTVDVQVWDNQGNTLTQGEMRFDYPAFKELYRSSENINFFPYPGNYPNGFGAAIFGMQVGGVRRFKLKNWQNNLAADSPKKWLISQDSTTLLEAESLEGPVVFEVKLKSVCKPKYCLLTTYSIPAMRDRKIVEAGCK